MSLYELWKEQEEERKARQRRKDRLLYWVWVGIWGFATLLSLALLPITLVPALVSPRVRAFIGTPLIAFLMMLQ